MLYSSPPLLLRRQLAVSLAVAAVTLYLHIPNVLAAVDDNGNVVNVGGIGGASEIWMPEHLKVTQQQKADMASKKNFDRDNEKDQERLHRFLMYELGQYNTANPDSFLSFYDYEDFYELDCPHRMMIV